MRPAQDLSQVFLQLERPNTNNSKSRRLLTRLIRTGGMRVETGLLASAPQGTSVRLFFIANASWGVSIEIALSSQRSDIETRTQAAIRVRAERYVSELVWSRSEIDGMEFEHSLRGKFKRRARALRLLGSLLAGESGHARGLLRLSLLSC